MNLNGEYIDEFESASEAEKILGIYNQSISLVCNKKMNQTGGYKFVFKKDYLESKI